MNWRKLSIMIVSRCANFLLGPTQFSRRYSSSISSAITATIPNNPKGGSNASVWRGSSLLPSSDHQLRFWNSILSLGKWMKCLLFPVVAIAMVGKHVERMREKRQKFLAARCRCWLFGKIFFGLELLLRY